MPTAEAGRAVMSVGPLLVEIGCTPWSGLHPAAIGQPFDIVTDPVVPNIALSANSIASLGSDFVRTGVVYRLPAGGGARVCDRLGVEWSTDGDSVWPRFHPLAEADATAIRTYEADGMAPAGVQVARGTVGRIIVDAPGPGLVETCCHLRGGWRFLDDCPEDSAEVGALLDWAEAFVCQSYADALALCGGSDIVVYRDVLGTETGPYFPVGDFARLVAPRLRSVLRTIRARTSASVAACIRGASRPLLPLLVGEGVTIIGVDCNARGMTVSDLRQAVGRGVILHGTADLVALGRSLGSGDMAGVAVLACELASALPAIAAPAAPVQSRSDRMTVARAASFLAALNADDLRTLATVGPVRSILEAAAARPVLPFSPEAPELVPWTVHGAADRTPGSISNPLPAPRCVAGAS